jgi:hypothetical protein
MGRVFFQRTQKNDSIPDRTQGFRTLSLMNAKMMGGLLQFFRSNKRELKVYSREKNAHWCAETSRTAAAGGNHISK